MKPIYRHETDTPGSYQTDTDTDTDTYIIEIIPIPIPIIGIGIGYIGIADYRSNPSLCKTAASSRKVAVHEESLQHV